MRILEDVHTAFGHIKIIESTKDGTVTYYQDEVFQSQADTSGTSTCGYIHAMASLMGHAHPQHVLVIGGAGGTLATLMHRRGCQVTLVDVNAYAFTLARRYFKLPAAVQCVEADGQQFLLNGTEVYDAIAIDAFNGKGVIPRQLTTTTCFRLVADALSEQGVMIMNIMTAHDLDMEADRIAQKASAAKLPVILFDCLGQQHRNTLLAAGQVKALDVPRFEEPLWLKRETKGMVRRLPRG